MKDLIKKFTVSMQQEGIKVTSRKTKNYVLDYMVAKKDKVANCYVDVLFINGCMLPHPMRYRVQHQAEQLIMANVTNDTVYYEQLDLKMVHYARVFIFFRCPVTDVVKEFIKKAKKFNKTVVFDIDDLVFDTFYTDTVKYVTQMPDIDRKLYDEGVKRIGETLSFCDIATTTTEELALELSKYVNQVHVNRNVASDKMLAISESALECLEDNVNGNRSNKEFIRKEPKQVSLGYFSGSITHNDDFAIILPVIQRLMGENNHIHLYLVGELDLPKELQGYANRIHTIGFMDWTKLPMLIAQMDINLAPLEDTIFNRAKSENKWTEASLVKVITIASNVGAFAKMIQDEVTGVLCANTKEDWYYKLKKVIADIDIRKKIAYNAYRSVKEYCITIETCWDYANFIKSVMKPNLMYKIPTAQISGGTLVAEKHAAILQNNGIDVFFINDGGEDVSHFTYVENEFPVIRSRSTAILGSIDTAIATLYTTMEFVQNYPNIKRRMYLVQGLETKFPLAGSWGRVQASQSYMPVVNVEFITVSKWCQKWLQEKYHKTAKYVPNGIDCNLFQSCERDFSGKVRILIEGNSDDCNKNVDESFKIVELLDKEKYEIWYISYQGKPKDWYRVDRFFRRVPNNEMPYIYTQCHILLKSSIFESFSYPPLEMMATGGVVVVRPNEGNQEYLEDERNCLFYDFNNLFTAVTAIERILEDTSFRNNIIINGIKTAEERDWSNIESQIINLYE